MTSPVSVYRRIYRKRTDPDGKRYAYSLGVPDIPFIPDIEPPVEIYPTDLITRLRGRNQAPIPQPTNPRENILFNTVNAMDWYTTPANWVNYGGILPGSTLTRYPASGEGDYNVPASAANSVPATLNGVSTGSTGTGTPIENMEFYGTVRTAALANVWFKNCIFRGTVNAVRAEIGAIEATSLNLRGMVVQDSLISIRNNNTWHTGIRGSNWTGYRTEIIGAADGISWNATGGNVKLYGMWLHDGAYDEWAAGDSNYLPQGSNYLHCDGIQSAQGAGYYARGCVIGGQKTGQWSHHAGAKANILAGDDFYNAAILMAQAPATGSPAVQYLTTGTIEQCVLIGGGATVNVATSNGYNLSGVTIKDNIFPYRNDFPTGSGQWYILKTADCAVNFSNNTHPDGRPVTIITS